MLSPRAPDTGRGSIIFLFPVAMTVVFILGAITVDVALVQTRGRELAGVAGSAANDALAGLDVGALRRGDGIVISLAAAEQQVRLAVATGPLPEARVEAVTVATDGQGRTVISVTLSLVVDLVMAPAVGDLDQVVLTRTERATILGSDLL